MRLVFPNGEHGQVLLARGTNRIGSGGEAEVVLDHPDVAALHCEIRLGDGGATLTPAPGAEVSVNGKPVRELIALRSGDMLGLAGIQVRAVAVEVAQGEGGAGMATDEATRLRPAVPRLVLRGVSAPVFGKVFPLNHPLVVGRAPECDLPIASEEISRRHARLTPVGDSVEVEDLGSANGTFIAGQRIESGRLEPGQELRLDAVRFLLVAPGRPAAAADSAAPREPTTPGVRWLPLAVIVAALVAIGLLVVMRGG